MTVFPVPRGTAILASSAPEPTRRARGVVESGVLRPYTPVRSLRSERLSRKNQWRPVGSPQKADGQLW
jgi:hypothetical protein